MLSGKPAISRLRCLTALGCALNGLVVLVFSTATSTHDIECGTAPCDIPVSSAEQSIVLECRRTSLWTTRTLIPLVPGDLYTLAGLSNDLTMHAQQSRKFITINIKAITQSVGASQWCC